MNNVYFKLHGKAANLFCRDSFNCSFACKDRIWLTYSDLGGSVKFMWHSRNTGDVFSVFYSRGIYLQCHSSSRSVMMSHKIWSNTGKMFVISTRFHGLFALIISIQVGSARRNVSCGRQGKGLWKILHRVLKVVYLWNKPELWATQALETNSSISFQECQTTHLYYWLLHLRIVSM